MKEIIVADRRRVSRSEASLFELLTGRYSWNNACRFVSYHHINGQIPVPDGSDGTRGRAVRRRRSDRLRVPRA